eukprot:TRINITY_DN8073_c0_g1_i1.p1 TRINITY_DN8073_c0_g1~~TRINITY_DN8073_c0_g1_i1.p1  ORF type:complete len:940 (+),score=250.13 TRINITY_DN8073_c0_g1_i1:191-3010(+)
MASLRTFARAPLPIMLATRSSPLSAMRCLVAARHTSYDQTTKLLNTRFAHDPLSASSPPLYQTATFSGIDAADAAFDYTRSGNPTRHHLEDAIATLEHAEQGFAFTSGMAALTAVVRGLTRQGDRIVAGSDLYGGLHRMLSYVGNHNGLDVEFVDLTDLDAAAKAIDSNTKLVFAESPTNPLMQVVDLRAISRLCHGQDALLCVDNSVMSPLLCNPHKLGADIVMNSATKFLNGHSDTMAGIITTVSPDTAQAISFVQNAEGAGLAPFDSWLVYRGVKTLKLRQTAAQRNAELLVKTLAQHPLVGQVNYLHPDDVATSPEAELHFRQARGGGSVFSFEPACGTVEYAQRVLSLVKLYRPSVSFGSVHSQIEMPGLHSHASIPEEERTLPPALIRISVGTEDVNDLIQDITQALEAAAHDLAPSLVEHHLGCPLPANEPLHACTASMPKWQDVVGYEEADPRVLQALQCGYPRFVYPPTVKRLIATLEHDYANDNETCIPCPSARVAARMQTFLSQCGVSKDQLKIVDLHLDDVCAVVLPRAAAGLAKSYWQHMGELVSSRWAHHVLNHLEGDAQPFAVTQGHTDARQQLRKRIAQLAEQEASDVFCYQSGMAAISSCTRVLVQSAAKSPRAGAKAVVLGFPYLDTLKQLQHPHLGPGAHFIPDGDIRKLEAIAAQEPVLAVYIEVPSNPLLKTVDVTELRKVADQYNFPIVADDSIGNFCNIDVLNKPDAYADILVSSLTKTFSGRGNVMGGSMIINPRSAWYKKHMYTASRGHQDLLFMDDAQALLSNAATLEARNARVSASAEALADYLAQHPAVDKVHYPKYNNPEQFRSIARNDETWGGLMSVILKDESKASAVYDALRVPKGPGFGTNFTLVCPYTLLAHYQELDFVRQHGVDPNLLRVWVGLEPVDEIIAAFEEALVLAEPQSQDASTTSAQA